MSKSATLTRIVAAAALLFSVQSSKAQDNCRVVQRLAKNPIAQTQLMQVAPFTFSREGTLIHLRANGGGRFNLNGVDVLDFYFDISSKAFFYLKDGQRQNVESARIGGTLMSNEGLPISVHFNFNTNLKIVYGRDGTDATMVGDSVFCDVLRITLQPDCLFVFSGANATARSICIDVQSADNRNYYLPYSGAGLPGVWLYTTDASTISIRQLGNGVLENGVRPISIHLQVYPSVLSGMATFSFSLPQGQTISLRVYDAAGREVGAPIDHSPLAAEVYRIPFDFTPWPSGSYFVQLFGPSGTSSQRVEIIH